MWSPEFRRRFRATREAFPDLDHHAAVRVTQAALCAESQALRDAEIVARFVAFKLKRGIP